MPLCRSSGSSGSQLKVHVPSSRLSVRCNDDSGLGDAIDSAAAVEALGADGVRLLQELSRALTRVDEALTDEELIASQPMDRVRELAAAAIAAIPPDPAA